MMAPPRAAAVPAAAPLGAVLDRRAAAESMVWPGPRVKATAQMPPS
jgi:hypothetical protein